MSLTIGAHTYGNPILRGHHNNITIGKFCSIAEGVIFDGGFSHNHRNVSTYPFNPNWLNMGISSEVSLNLNIKGDINIGNDVWIGEGAVIMSGVTVGDGAVIGMRAIITKDISPYTVVVGNHRVLYNRFPLEQIQELMLIKWWDWDDETIMAAAPYLVSENIDEFIEFADSLKDNG